ncbi:TetR/AcrR family transcriptional regulator [Prescottella agglutinans]|uniref:AcrR family transcriptional regulator n=1 Tax=Prescottella agglutinans TaxID=1644129 RepID=A0ABT6MJ27_9NOCA|nr:TetR/AcrR family transcriptional regulator [Prescottella agglutinans]MDH6283874.1 AcrR family transcriptional regulator [Prescottella agglutinans]
MDGNGPARGRPRDPARHRAVLEATAELLIEGGYEAVTFAAVARRADVGRPLLYQWWGSKAALVQETLFRREPLSASGIAEDAPFAETFTAMVRDMVALQLLPEYRCGMPGLIADMVADRELQDEAERRFIAPVRARYVEVFDRAIAAGEIRPDVDGGLVLDTLRGALTTLTLVRSDWSESDLVDYLTRLVLDGIMAS